MHFCRAWTGLIFSSFELYMGKCTKAQGYLEYFQIWKQAHEGFLGAILIENLSTFQTSNLSELLIKQFASFFKMQVQIVMLLVSSRMQVKLKVRAFELKLPTFRSSMFLFLKWLAAAKSFWLVLLAKKLQHWKVCIEMSCGDEKRRNINKLVESETWSYLCSWIAERNF